MKKQVLFAAIAGALFLGCSVVVHAQDCQNQVCQGPNPNNPSCWTCISEGATGWSCSLSGSCPQSCATASCTPDPCATSPGSAECCAQNPVSQGCMNPCVNNPQATLACGTLIVCDGVTITDNCTWTGSNIGGGNGSGSCINGSCLAKGLDRPVLKDVAALVPRAPVSCQAPVLPKKLLFSL